MSQADHMADSATSGDFLGGSDFLVSESQDNNDGTLTPFEYLDAKDANSSPNSIPSLSSRNSFEGIESSTLDGSTPGVAAAVAAGQALRDQADIQDERKGFNATSEVSESTTAGPAGTNIISAATTPIADRFRAASSSSSPSSPSRRAVEKSSPVTRSTSTSNLTPGSNNTSSSTALIPAVDLNQTLPWKWFYPVISRDTFLSLCQATAINFVLPFINGVFLGFGEICAHELAYRWGWTSSARVVSVPGRPAGPGQLGLGAAPVPVTSSSSVSGIGSLARYDEKELSK